MRWFFLFVLVLNIAYIAIELDGEPPAQSSAPPLPEDVPTIVLLSELGKSVKVQRQPDEEVAGASSAVESADSSEVAVAADRCYTLGPFRELMELRDFTRAIKNYVKSASFRSRDEKEQTTFQVFLKPMANQEAALAMSERLKKMNVKDHYIIKTGEKENGISLGHFSEKNRAFTHAASIKKLGFAPLVEAVFKDYTLYWLDYRVIAGKQIPDEVFQQNLGDKVNHLQRQCA